MRIRLTIVQLGRQEPLMGEDAPGVFPAPQFFQLAPRRKPMLASLAGSVAFHCALLAVLPVLIQLLPSTRREVVRVAVLPPERTPLVLRLPDSLIRVRPMQAQKKRLPPPPRVQPAKPAPRGGGAQAAVTKKGESASLLILPEPAPILKMEAPKLPMIVAWTEAPPPKPPEEVKAGERNPRPRAPLPQSDPSLRAPKPAPVVDPIPLPEISRTSNRGLILNPSGSSPFRAPMRDIPMPELPAAPSLNIPGENIAIISISPRTANPGEVVKIPAATILPEGASPSAASSTGRTELASRGSGGAGAGPASGSAAGGAGSAKAGSGGGAGAGAGAGREPGVVGTGGATTASPLTALGPALSTIPVHGGLITVHKAGDGSIHLAYPKGGNYDVVVVQSPGSSDEPELRILRGGPVHTVYLNVGGPKEWILQFCLAAEGDGASARHGPVVSAAPVPALTPPYAQTIILPPTGAPSPPRRIVIQGKLGAEGKFRDLKALSGPAHLILPWLPRWEFRAAQAGGKPAAVDIVLMIPAAEVM